MKKSTLALLLCITLCVTIEINAQEKFKFGNVPQSELERSVYDKDTSASAVVLHKECKVSYTLMNDELRVMSWNTVRIKILKQTGTSHANFEIPYYQGEIASNNDLVTSITGFTYNLENGKVEKTKISKEHIFEEKTSENYYTKKITFPNVKAGSVVELKYLHQSPHYMYLDDYNFQDDIPVAYNIYNIVIPEYFHFSKNQQGYEPLKYTENSQSVLFNLKGGGMLNASGREMTFEGYDLPALKGDSYVWNKEDFTTKVNFDLAGIQWPQSIYKSFATTWAVIDERLMKSDAFGSQLTISNLLKDDMIALNLTNDKGVEDKMTAILALVKSKIQWNGENRLYVEGVRKALRQARGSSADMNALLITLLRDAGLDANPVVMRLRSNGRIHTSYPSQKKLNYFIVAVNAGDKTYYLDASYKYAAVDAIPLDCMVENARYIGLKGGGSKWVDLQKTGSSSQMNNMITMFDKDGFFTGSIQSHRKGVAATVLRTEIDKDSLAYQKDIAAKWEMDISNYQFSNSGSANATRETFNFKSPAAILGEEYIYLNPLIVAFYKENPFKAETRKLPVEYAYPYNNIQTVTIQIPDDYAVEEVPSSEIISFDEDNSIVFSYRIQKQSSSVQLQYRLSLNRTIYAATEYEFLRDFWNRIISKGSAMVVLKKVSE